MTQYAKCMPTTIFIFGRLPDLSEAELAAVLSDPVITLVGDGIAQVAREVAEPDVLLRRLGGTVKIAVPVAGAFSVQTVADDLRARASGRVNFGMSWYHQPAKHKEHLAAGLQVKAELAEAGISSRLVTSREPILSSVVVSKNHATEYLVLPGGSLARTVAVQDVEDAVARDVGRPHRDLESGTLPPKLARMMINLARVSADSALLDPFCGSGTILTEAALLGVPTVWGSDVADRAVTQSQQNLAWLAERFPQTKKVNTEVKRADVRTLSSAWPKASVDAIVTEPYLGPPRHGNESRPALRKVIGELSDLYLAAFAQFAQVLKPGGRVVIVLPEFVFGHETMPLPIADDVARLGFRLTSGPHEYSRPDQHVRRQITVWASGG